MGKLQKAFLHFLGVELATLLGAAIGVIVSNTTERWISGLLIFNLQVFSILAFLPALIVAVLFYHKFTPEIHKTTLRVLLPSIIIFTAPCSLILAAAMVGI